MARREEILFSEEEQELVAAVLAAEGFRDTCWADYGPFWVDHLPQVINAFCFHYFGTYLPPYVVALYYAPQREITVHGARGCAKTVSIALAMAIYHTLHPGEPWIHVSPVKDQAARTYEAIMLWGNKPLGHANWYERFVASTVVAPFHEIRLKPWSPEDPGNIFRFRPLADEIEHLRSMEAGTITVDEAFRATPNPDVYPQLRGCIRGINTVRQALLPQDVQAEIHKLIEALAVETAPRKRRSIERKLEALYTEHHLNRRGLLMLYGNVADYDWEWERYELGADDPEHYFSITVTSYDNPYLGRRSIEDMERSYGENVALRDTEMFAKRPINPDGMFVSIAANLDLQALPKARLLAKIGRAVVEEGPLVGIYRYELEPEPTHFYVCGADPGAGVAPGRNKWVILVYDLAVRPVQLVYFRMGHLDRRRKGDITAFWDELKLVSARYPHYPGDVWIESTANQKGQAQLAMPEDISVTAVSLSTTKPVLINQLRMLFDRHIFALPDLPAFMREHNQYEIQDKELTQDIVMANICAAGAIWKYIDFAYDLRNMGAPNEENLGRRSISPDRHSRPSAVRERRVSHPLGIASLDRPATPWVGAEPTVRRST